MSFFHLPKQREFKVNYRYFDPQKEEREKREDRIRSELGLNDEEKTDYRNRIEGQFRQQLRANKQVGVFARAERKKSRMRVTFILALLILLFVYFIFM